MSRSSSRAFHLLDPRGARMRLAIAIAVGVLAWLIVPWHVSGTTRMLLGWDAAGAVLIASYLFIILRSDVKETRRRAAAYDPGRHFVWFLVLAASAFSLFAAIVVLRRGGAGAFERALHVGLCVASVAISWLVTHLAFSLRYAHVYYRDGAYKRRRKDGSTGQDADSKDGKEKTGGPEGGIDLPGGQLPDDFDFAYFSFTLGMCFQVSDATISSRAIRRLALGHALLSFAYNTVILALAMNLIVGQLG